MTELEKAQNYINEKKDKVNNRFRPIYHASVPVGWMNDPNGFIYSKGEYHLFYQYYPFETKWGPMHWGHSISKDLVKWYDAPVALAPDSDYDRDLGCFSGTAINIGEQLVLMYTGVVQKKDEPDKQQQCLAYSEDGITFTKYNNNPVISTEQIPEGFNKVDFRDPKVFIRDGIYYCLIGCRKEDDSSDCIGGNVLLYSSNNMHDWSFVGKLFDKTITITGVVECPDIFSIEGKDVLICSPQNLENIDHRYTNSSSSVYFVGSLNLQTGRFEIDNMDEIDNGFDFYAPQALNAPDGRIVMTAWMNMWGRTYPTAADGWVGSTVFPRELDLKGNYLIQKPAREIENYFANTVTVSNIEVTEQTMGIEGIAGNTVMLELDVDLTESNGFIIKLFADEVNEVLLSYDKKSNLLSVDRSKTEIDIELGDTEKTQGNYIRKTKPLTTGDRLKLSILLDVSTIEVFVNDGEKTLSTNVYPAYEKKNEGIFFSSISGKTVIKQITKHDIHVK